MIFAPTPLAGAVLVEPERHEDARGFFARTFCQEEFRRHGLDPVVAQCNVSFNPRAFTLRGMHYQAAPVTEAKLVRCTRGAVYDVILDLRPTSPSYRRHFAVELTWQKRNLLYIPPGLAHGFLTLEGESEVFYQMSTPYRPESGRGVRWNDPAFGIAWPREPALISERDRDYPDFAGEETPA